MKEKNGVSRRDLIKNSLKVTSIAGLMATHPFSHAFGVTPSQTEGPFHPINRDTDLTRHSPGSSQAEGQVIYIQGQVTDEQNRPQSGALVEIWQAASNGKYNHPGDPNPKPIDPNFQYWGRASSDSQGRYQFKTIKPGHYPATATWTRPAHIHVRIMKRGFHDLTTQLYFKAETQLERQLLENDRILMALPPLERQQLIVDLVESPSGLQSGSKVGQFNIELNAVL